MSDVHQALLPGTITHLDAPKGFGFIHSEELGDDWRIFFHASVLRAVRFEDLHEGLAVDFAHEKTERGLTAIVVQLP